MATTSRGFRYPAIDGSDTPDVPRDIKNLADDVDAQYSSGSSLPAFGVVGRHFLRTDGTLWLDTGTAWLQIGLTRFYKSLISTTETRSATTYGLLTTPDRVQGVVVPTDALLEIAFTAVWQRDTSASDARAAIFIGSNQLQKAGTVGTGGGVQEAQMNTANTNLVDQILASGGGGLFSTDSVAGGSPSPAVSTGQIVGGGTKAVSQGTSGEQHGVIPVFVAAGTYDISVQYKVSAGILSVKGRKLWVTVKT